MKKHYTEYEMYLLLQKVIVYENDCKKLAKILYGYDFISLSEISIVITKISKGREK